MKLFIDKKNLFAIVGASNNKNKFGYKVFYDLKKAGYKVIPINPKEKTIQGVKAYSSIVEIKEKIDVVILLVPKHITLRVLEEVKDLEIPRVWMQPGSGSNKAVEFCEKNDIDYIKDSCIMVVRHKK